MSSQADQDELWRSRGDYLSVLAEEHYYAIHPMERPYDMTDAEVAEICRRYDAEVHHA